MSELAWPAVTLVAVLVLVWRADAFARRWSGPYIRQREWNEWKMDFVRDLNEWRDKHLQPRLDEFAAVRDKLNQLSARLGPPR